MRLGNVPGSKHQTCCTSSDNNIIRSNVLELGSGNERHCDMGSSLAESNSRRQFIN